MNGWIKVAFLSIGLALAAACDNGGGGGSKRDFGDNDPNKILCVGDSITSGGCAPAGAPYPSRLGSLSGKSVVNGGACGETSIEGVGRARRLLATHKPGFICILYGANDASFGYSTTSVKESLRAIVQAAKGQKTVVFLGTITPTYGPHGYSNGGVDRINTGIRELAKEEGVALVDINREFGDDPTLIQDDGLHPSDTGTQIIAAAFNDKV